MAARRASTALSARRRVAAPARDLGAARRAVVVALGLAAVLAAGIVLVLSHAAQRRVGSNGVYPAVRLAVVGAGSTFCQPRELLPAGTAALRMPVAGRGGPELLVTLRARAGVLDRVRVPPGWTGGSVRVPIAAPSRDVPGVGVCLRVAGGGTVAPIGFETPPHVGVATVDGVALGRSARIDYLGRGARSWWSSIPTVMRRVGLGRGGGRSWPAWLALALTLAAWALAGRLLHASVIRDRAGVVATARAIAAIGLLNAAAWSLITPLFQVPDEITHIAYTQQIAETGRPPVDKPRTVFSPELTVVAADLHNALDIPEYRVAPVWTDYEAARLARDLDASPGRRGNDDADASDPEPPLFYALEAIPYTLLRSGTLPDRIALMRLLAAATAGLTALFVFLFVRECLPRQPWAWTVGGLGAAFAPMFGYVSGGVNPDALLFAVAAGLFYVLARAFRRGLTPRLAVAIGALLGIGLIAKINFYGLLPGALVAVALAARRSEGAWNRRVAELVGMTAAIGFAPFAVVTTLDALAWERPAILARSVSTAHDSHGGLLGQLSYLWQVYLPRLPGQHDAIAGPYLGYEAWLKTFVGAFGPLEVLFPAWVYRVALAAFVALAVLAVRAGLQDRAQLRARAPELAGYLLMVGVLLLLIGLVALRGWAPTVGAAAQGRYLLPLLALFGAFLALAARGAGPRWGRALGAAIVVAAIGWSLFGQLITIGFFYA